MSKILAALLVFIFFILTVHAEDQFSLKWTYKTDGEIFVLTAGDINADGLNELVISSGNNLYVLDKDGKLTQDYRINFTGKISAVDIADLDNDGKNEIILGTGWMETTDVNEEPFNLSGLTMIEKQKRLIKTVRNKGRIYLIDDRTLSKFQDVDGWIRAIDVSKGEIFVSTGGSDIDFFEEIFYDSNGTKRRNYTDYSTWRGNIFILNKTELIKEYRADNIFYSISTQEDEIFAGSGNTVYAFDMNFVILWKYTAMGTVKNLYVGYMGDDDKRIIASFSNSVDGIHVLNSNGAELWTYRLPFQSKISGFSVGNIDLDKDNEIIVSDKNKIYVLDSSGRVRSEHWINGGIDRIYLTDLDSDGYMDLIISSKNTVTVYEVTEILIKKQLADRYYGDAKEFYEGRNYEQAKEYIKNATILYIEINDTEGISRADLLYYKILNGIMENRMMEADSLYSNALGYYGFNDYISAMDYAKKAIAIYLEINDIGGISRTNSLITEIKKKIVNITEETTTTTKSTIYVSNATSDKIKKIPEISNYLIVFVVVVVLIIILIFIKTRKSKD